MVNTFEYSVLPIAKCKLLTETEWQGKGRNVPKDHSASNEEMRLRENETKGKGDFESMRTMRKYLVTCH